MKKTSTIVIILFVSALLVLGIGYAALQNITLNIIGTASAEPNQESFDIVFSGDHTISDEGCAVVTMVDDITSNILVTGLTAKGESLIVEYDVKNSSNALSADLEVLTQNSNTEYFLLTSYTEKGSLMPKEKTKLKVKVELIKTPIEEIVSSDIEIVLKSSPVEPGKEGSSGTVNKFSQT